MVITQKFSNLSFHKFPSLISSQKMLFSCWLTLAHCEQMQWIFWSFWNMIGIKWRIEMKDRCHWIKCGCKLNLAGRWNWWTNLSCEYLLLIRSWKNYLFHLRLMPISYWLLVTEWVKTQVEVALSSWNDLKIYSAYSPYHETWAYNGENKKA